MTLKVLHDYLQDSVIYFNANTTQLKGPGSSTIIILKGSESSKIMIVHENIIPYRFHFSFRVYISLLRKIFFFIITAFLDRFLADFDLLV